MIIGIYGPDTAHEMYALQLPRPFIVSHGQHDAHLFNPGPHDLALLAARLLRLHGVPWAFGTDRFTMPAHDLRVLLGQLSGRPLTTEEATRVSPDLADVVARVVAAAEYPPQTIIINSAADWHDTLIATAPEPSTAQATANVLMREALTFLAMTTPVVLLGDSEGFPRVVTRQLDLRIWVAWDPANQRLARARVEDVRASCPELEAVALHHDLPVSDLIGALGFPSEVEDLDKV